MYAQNSVLEPYKQDNKYKQTNRHKDEKACTQMNWIKIYEMKLIENEE